MIKSYLQCLHAMLLLPFLFMLTLFNQDTLSIRTPYGSCIIHEPVLIELINHHMLQRLKKVRQYGISYYLIKAEEYNRFEHSLGVFFLLRAYGASLNEQIAGLLHDVSHTVFSHVGDWIFKHPDGLSSYQDDIHEQFLTESGISLILEKHGIYTQDIHHKSNAFGLLEQELPNLCADRIEYNLQGGLREGLISKHDLQGVLKHLHVINGTWVFTDRTCAKQLADISLYHTQYIWGSREQLLVYALTGKLLRETIKFNYFTLDDIHFGTDDDIWQRLHNIEDTRIQQRLHQLKNFKQYFSECNTGKLIKAQAKFRGLDPYVLYNNQIKRLTEIDSEYASRFYALKNQCLAPINVRSIN